MLIAAFFQWWYGPGWVQQLRNMERRVKNIAGMFSMDILLRTMFSPWKQIVSRARRDQSLGDKVRAYIDNQVSRFVGFWVRLLVLLTAFICILLVSVVSVVSVVLWPLIPLSPIILVLFGAGVI